MRRITVAERRARLATRHHIAPAARAGSVVEVAGDLVGLHGTDAASVYIAAFARLRDPSVEVAARALYDERSVLRMLGMRRTMFVTPIEIAPVLQAACTRAIAVRERRRLVQLLEEGGVAADGGDWLRPVEKATMRALVARGEATAAELGTDVAGLREMLQLGEGKKWAGSRGVSSSVLFLLAADGLVVRGRPKGTWNSTQYRWAPVETWLPGGLPHLATDAARVELVTRWLTAFGPGTVADLKWWTGLTLGEVRKALAVVEPVEVDLEGATGLVLPDDLAPVAGPEPWAALLPALDPTVMGWTERGWYLGDHRPALFDRSGNAGPTVWWDGRVVGGWAQRKDGEIVVRLLDDVGSDATAAVQAEADRLAPLLGNVRVTPRFRTPLERELTT